MKILIVSDTFYPASNAAARMLYDMYLYLKLHHDVSIITGGIQDQTVDDISYFKLRRSKKNILRLFNELYFTYRLIFRSKPTTDIDMVIWYSPSIFLSIFISLCFRKIPRVLLLRDLFPLWLEQEATLKPGLGRFFLRFIERFQYRTADITFVQTPGDVHLIKERGAVGDTRVLYNWYSVSEDFVEKSVNASLDSQKIKIIYAGNAGIAQKLEESVTSLSKYLLQAECSAELHIYSDKVNDLSQLESESLRIKVFEPFDFHSTHLIYQNYDFGLVSLNTKLTTNNIPGKYVSYIAHALPVFVYCSHKIDLFTEVNEKQIGVALNSDTLNYSCFNNICKNYSSISANARNLFIAKYSVASNLKILLKALENAR